MQVEVPRRTARTVLRPLEERDVDDVLAYRSRADVCRFLTFEPMDRAEVADFVAEVAGRAEIDADHGGLVLGVEHEGRVVGDLKLSVGRLMDSQGEIGWVFHPDVGGRGLATEAATSLVDAAFHELHLHRVWAQLDPRNTASSRLAERLGMRREALLREESWFKGEWGDLAIYGLLLPEWEARREVWT